MRTCTPEPAGGMQVGARVTLAEGSLGLRAAQKGHLCLSTSGVGHDVGEVVEVDSTSRGSGKLTLKVRASCGGEAWYKEEQLARTKAAFRPSTSCVQWAMSQQGVLENAELALCRENEMLARQQVSRARIQAELFLREFERESCAQVGEERKERQKAEARVRALEAQLAEKEDAARALLESVQSKEAAQLKSPPAAAAPKDAQKQPVQMEDPKASPPTASPPKASSPKASSPKAGVAKTPSRSPAADQGEALAKAERRAAAAEQQLKALREQQQAQRQEEERKQLDQNWVCPNYMCKNVNCESGSATVDRVLAARETVCSLSADDLRVM